MPKSKQPPVPKEHRELLIKLKQYFKHYKKLEELTNGLLKADTISAICRDENHGTDDTTRFQIAQLIEQQQEVLSILRHRDLWTSSMSIQDVRTGDESLAERMQSSRFLSRAGDAIKDSNRLCNSVTIISHDGIRSAELIRSLLASKHTVDINLYLRDPLLVPVNDEGVPEPDLAISSLYFLISIGDILSLENANSQSKLSVYTYDGRYNTPRAALFGDELVALCDNSEVDVNNVMRGHPVHYDGRKVQGNQIIDVFLSGHHSYDEKQQEVRSLFTGDSPGLKQIECRLEWTKDSAFSHSDLEYTADDAPDLVVRALRLSQRNSLPGQEPVSS